MKKIIIILAPFVVLLFFAATFVLEEGQQAIVLQFGDPVSEEPYQEAGLYFKLTLIHNVIKR